MMVLPTITYCLIKGEKNVDVLITSTCRKTIEKCIASFLENVKYTGQFRFFVNIDVKNPKYLPRLQKFLKKQSIYDVKINMHPKEKLQGLPETINYLYNQVESKYYFNLQDDWIFLDKINLDPLVTLMNNNSKIDHIRLNKEIIEQNEWLYHLFEKSDVKHRKKSINIDVDGINLVKLSTWSFNPSLCRTETMKNILPVPIDDRAETHFCKKYDELYSARGTFFLGSIGDKARIKDIGRNFFREIFRKYKHQFLPSFINAQK